ncbi:GntP family permease [Oceanobacillus sp. M60]|uniref:GntP family permease n=1 Tax=Oceanobacillus oncorhynchi TaxID=545501 RepID=UPI0021163B71|nr:gluconate:H+ symporter [Oceanobacillus oncorhynchi]UUI41773.1 GntP family permease [Oceanobacillus oncorhynchi]
MESTAWIITVGILAMVILLFLIIRTKLQAFLALIIASLFVGLAVGMPPQELLAHIEEAMGGTLGFVALIIGIGTIFGEVLRASGASEKLALTLMDKFGEKNIVWALGASGFLISIAVFIDVAIVILVPLTYALVRKSKKSLLYYGIPLTAGLSVTHTFIPPTPGPIATASIIGADLGYVILFGVIAGIPAMIIAGPLFGKFISKKIHVDVPEHFKESEVNYDPDKLPGFAGVVIMLIAPLILILGNTTADLLLDEGNIVREILMFIGNPIIALLIVSLLTIWLYGTRRGFTKGELQKITTRALEPAGIIILITGAGGVFGQTLIATGIGDILADAMQQINMPIILFGFITAALIRITQGSGTVSMITAASLVSPLIQHFDVSEPMLGLVTIAIACGGTAFSHVNDSGFWMANRYFGMSVADTLKSWTVMKTLVGLTGLAVVLILSLFIK